MHLPSVLHFVAAGQLTALAALAKTTAAKPSDALAPFAAEPHAKRSPAAFFQQRDYRRHPVLLQLTDAQAPTRLYVLGDNHAAFNQTTRVLLGNGLIVPCTRTPEQNERCGQLPKSAWGDFRFTNPYCWAGKQGSLVKTGDDVDKGAFNLALACFWLDMIQEANEAGDFVWPLWGNHEASLLGKATNSKTMGPGGLNFELYHFGIDPEHFTSEHEPYGKLLRQRALFGRIGPFFFSHAGVTRGLSLANLVHAATAALKAGGPNDPFLNSEDGLLRGRSPGGVNGSDGPRMAALLDPNPEAPVRTIVYGHDPERAPRGHILAYGTDQDGEPSLISEDVGLSPVIGYSGLVGGSLLRIDQNASHYALSACERRARCVSLGAVGRQRNPTKVSVPAAGTGRLRAAEAKLPRGENLVRAPIVHLPAELPLAPGRRRAHGRDRDFKRFATIVPLPTAGEVIVLGNALGDLRRTKTLLAKAGLIGPVAPVASTETPGLWAPVHTLLDRAGQAALGLRPRPQPRPIGLYDPYEWTGGAKTLIQLGNQFGFGYAGLETMQLYQNLEALAAAKGGRVVSLNGAREVDLIAAPNNADTWGPGGLGIQLTGLDLHPREFVDNNGTLISWLVNRPFGVAVHRSLILPAGQTSNRRWQDMADALAESMRTDGFAAALISGENSCTKSIAFAGKDGEQGPKLAATAGVDNIIHGYDEQMAPVGKIKAYGLRRDKTPSLYNVETGYNAAKQLGEGEYLRIVPSARHLTYLACRRQDSCSTLAKTPIKPSASLGQQGR